MDDIDTSEIASIAHRWPPAVVGAPSLHLCLGYVNPSAIAPTRPAIGADIPTAGQAGWYKRLDKFHAELYQTLCGWPAENEKIDDPWSNNLVKDDSGYHLRLHSHIATLGADGQMLLEEDPLSGPIGSVPAGSSFTFAIEFLSQDVLVKLRSIYGTEILTLSLHIDLCKEVGKPHRQRCDAAIGSPIGPTHDALAKALDEMARKLRVGREQPASSRVSDAEIEKHHTAVYTTPSVNFLEIVNRIKRCSDADIGRQVADFRILTLCAPNAFKQIRIAGAEVRDLPGTSFFQRAFKVPQPSALATAPEELFDDKPGQRARDALATVWPLVSYGSKPRAIPACLMLDNRVLYASTLLPDGRSAAPRGEAVEPLKVVLVSSTCQRWQIGRLIDRIQTLGILRIAGLLQLKHIQSANGDIRDAARSVERLYGLFATSASSGNGDRADRIKRGGELLAGMFGQLQKINQNFPSGLSYRVQRSRYYRKQYVSLAEQLRETRVEGFQKYTDAVNHSLGANYDFIDRVGSRYESLFSRVQLLQTSLQAEEILKQESDITKVQRSTRNVSNRLLSISKAADLAFFFIIGPHYFKEITYPILLKLTETEASDTLEHSYTMWVVFAWWVLGLFKWLSGRDEKQDED